MKKNKNVIILHGWGLHSGIYRQLSTLLAKHGYRVYIPDLPGFGSQPLLSPAMSLDEYVLFLRGYIKEKKIKKPVVIGHSFGGRIALKYSFLYPNDFSKLILTGVPIIRNLTLGKKVVFLITMIGGKLFKQFPYSINNFLRKSLYYAIGEWDYYNSGPLKIVFKNIIEEDLTNYARGIKIPVLVVWGARDKIVAVSNLEKIKKFFPSAQIKVINEAGHKLPYENAQAFLNSIEAFI